MNADRKLETLNRIHAIVMASHPEPVRASDNCMRMREDGVTVCCEPALTRDVDGYPICEHHDASDRLARIVSVFNETAPAPRPPVSARERSEAVQRWQAERDAMFSVTRDGMAG